MAHRKPGALSLKCPAFEEELWIVIHPWAFLDIVFQQGHLFPDLAEPFLNQLRILHEFVPSHTSSDASLEDRVPYVVERQPCFAKCASAALFPGLNGGVFLLARMQETLKL